MSAQVPVLLHKVVSAWTLSESANLVIPLIKTFTGWLQHSGKYPNKNSLILHFPALSSIPHQLKGQTPEILAGYSWHHAPSHLYVVSIEHMQLLPCIDWSPWRTLIDWSIEQYLWHRTMNSKISIASLAQMKVCFNGSDFLISLIWL